MTLSALPQFEVRQVIHNIHTVSGGLGWCSQRIIRMLKIEDTQLLLLAVFNHREIFLLQIGHRSAFCIARYHIHHN